jgi:hypothetical protein
MTKLQTVTKTHKEKEYAKRALRCHYDASKELREIHKEEFTELLNRYKLKAGIVPRSLSSKHKEKLIEVIAESEVTND